MTIVKISPHCVLNIENINKPQGYYMYGSSRMIKDHVKKFTLELVYIFLINLSFFSFELSDFVAALFS